MQKPLLFQRYPELEGRIAWEPLGDFPTPIEKLDSLGAKLGHKNLWVKRDDLSSDKMGGNKVRVMEFLLALMKQRGKRVAISPGALGSNQIMASAIYGRQLGLDVVGIFFKQCPTDYMCKHMLIDKSMGVDFVHVENPYFTPVEVLRQFLKHTDWKKLETPFYIPSFGSSAVCALGYVSAMIELKEQIDAGQAPEPDYIFVTAGTGGTMAGIELGARIVGLRSKVVGVRITDWIALNEWLAANLINRAAKYLRDRGAPIGPFKYRSSDVRIVHEYFGGEYARITPEGIHAKNLCKETDGIVLDTTYTAKTMAAMIDFIRTRAPASANILFWHTYNTRDLAPFLGDGVDRGCLPSDFHCYFGE